MLGDLIETFVIVSIPFAILGVVVWIYERKIVQRQQAQALHKARLAREAHAAYANAPRARRVDVNA